MALVQEFPEVIELKKKVAYMQSEIAKAKLAENHLNVRLAERSQENVLLRERLGIGNSYFQFPERSCNLDQKSSVKFI